MLKIKKCLFIIVLSLTMGLLLAACSGSTNEGNELPENDGVTPEIGSNNAEVTIDFWKAPHTDQEKAIWDGIIEEFENENPNIKVEMLVTPWDTWDQQYTAAFSGSSPPDIAYMSEYIVRFSKSGNLMDLSSYVSPSELTEFSQSAIDYGTEDDKLYGIPFLALTSVMFYNKDIFEEEGLEIPETWEEFLHAAQVTTKGTEQWGFALRTNPTIDSLQAFNFMGQAGASLYNEDMTSVGFDNEAGITGLQFVTDLILTHEVAPPMDIFSTGEQMESQFYEGNIAMYPAQQQFSSEIRTNAPDLNFGAFRMPSGPADDPEMATQAYSGIGMLTIAEESEHPDEAYKFIEFVLQPEISSIYLEQVGFLSPKSSVNEVMYENDEIMQIVAEAVKTMQVFPPDINFGKVLEIKKNMFEASFRGIRTPEEAIQDAVNEYRLLQKE